MPCYHPLKGWRARAGPDKVSGKWPVVFKAELGNAKKPVLVACGKCIGCRLEYSRQWAIRCMKEAEMHEDNCFITLTYDNLNLERKTRIIDETGDNGKLYSLNKREFQLFMKRLRKNVWKNERKKIRYYHCGEYGEKTERPHHHVAIFGWTPNDAVLWKRKNGFELYTSEKVENAWKNGYCVIGSLSFESAAYIARYITKKIYGERSEEYYRGRQAEYTTCSNRPGIASKWYEKNKVDLEEDLCYVRKGVFARPPKYFDKLLEKENPLEMERRKIIRQKKVNLLTRKERLIKERIKKVKSKFKRSYENA